MQATSLPFGVVCATGQRYHPAIVAQAAATLQVMFPDRFWSQSAVASTSTSTSRRALAFQASANERLRNAQRSSALWAGETLDHRGHVVVEDAKLYTRPQRPPLLVGAAITPETARAGRRMADALITVAQRTRPRMRHR